MSAPSGNPLSESYDRPPQTEGPWSESAPTTGLLLCPSCGAGRLGPYCQGCGQRHAPLDSQRAHLQGLLRLDLRWLKSLSLALLQPGQLSLRWSVGRRGVQSSPLGFWLAAALLWWMTALAAQHGHLRPLQLDPAAQSLVSPESSALAEQSAASETAPSSADRVVSEPSQEAQPEEEGPADPSSKSSPTDESAEVKGEANPEMKSGDEESGDEESGGEEGDAVPSEEEAAAETPPPPAAEGSEGLPPPVSEKSPALHQSPEAEDPGALPESHESLTGDWILALRSPMTLLLPLLSLLPAAVQLGICLLLPSSGGIARALPLVLYSHGLGLILFALGWLSHSLLIAATPLAVAAYSLSALVRTRGAADFSWVRSLLFHALYLLSWLLLALLLRG